MYDHNNLFEKISATRLNMSPAMHDVLQRVREVGLHKVAAHMHTVPEFTLKTAAQLIGTSLVQHQLKFSKIAAGIRALQALDQSGEITLEKVARGALTKELLTAGAGKGGRIFEKGMAKNVGGTAAHAGEGQGAAELAKAIELSAQSGGVPPRARAPSRSMIGGMSAGPGAHMGMPGGTPGSSAARHQARLAYVLNPIDFAKMAGGAPSLFRLGAKGVSNVAHAAPQAANAGKAVEKDVLQSLPSWFKGHGTVPAPRQGAPNKGMFSAFEASPASPMHGLRPGVDIPSATQIAAMPKPLPRGV